MNRIAVLVLLPLLLQAGDFRGLAWMSGCWTVERGSITIEEQWNRPVGGQMMGLSRSLKAAKVVFSEFMQIDTESGGIFHTPRIGAKAPPVRFKLTSQSDAEVVFENPAHDFPQRFHYRRSPGGLFVRIDGVENGKRRAEDFPMKAVKCP